MRNLGDIAFTGSSDMFKLAALSAIVSLVPLVSAQASEYGQCKYPLFILVEEASDIFSGGGIGWSER